MLFLGQNASEQSVRLLVDFFRLIRIGFIPKASADDRKWDERTSAGRFSPLRLPGIVAKCAMPYAEAATLVQNFVRGVIRKPPTN
jgi:hypothetical protein